MSEIRSSVNFTQFTNATHVFLPTPRVPTEGWSGHVTASIAFVNFCVALACFLVRYSSVFWYTNKPLTIVFALQLLAMVLNSVFSFNSFSVLYCVCYNKKMYPNVLLSLSCALGLVLYLFGSTILMLSTMTVFEYGCHYFHEKFNIVERHHHPESYVKQTVVVNSGCQGYVPHSCAMAALIVFAVCKGPLLYDLVSLMRLTGDQLLLSGIICEVCYMVLWVALWFCLTIKQQWQFRILDYVSLRQPLYAIPEENVIKYSHTGHGDTAQNDSQTKVKRLSGRDFPQKYLEPVPAGATSSSEEQYHSDIGTDESDMMNTTTDIVLDLDGNPVAASFRRSRIRRNGGQRVTFDESVRSKGSVDKEKQQTPTSSLTRQGTVGISRSEDTSHFNVRADVHNSTPSTSNSSNESNQDGVILRKKPCIMDNREYRNSIRNKCGEYYSSVNNLSSSLDEAAVVSNPTEPLPTLMSSFRDKVRESSLAASTFRERERHMLEHFDYVDPLPPPIVEDLQSNDGEKRRGIAISDEDIGDVSYHIQKSSGDKNCSLGNNAGDNSRFRQLGNAEDAHIRQASTEVRYRFDDNINDGGFVYDGNVHSSSLTRQKQQNTSVSSDEGHRSSFANSTLESSDLSIPPAMEDLQLVGFRSGSGAGTARKEDYHLPHLHHPSHHQHNMVGSRFKYSQHPRPIQVVGKKNEIGRRDSANFSLTSSQDTSSNESDNGQGLCNQV